MNTLTAPTRTQKIKPGFSPKPTKRAAPRGEESDSPPPDTPSPSGALKREHQPVAKVDPQNGNGHPARIKGGIVSFS